MISLVSSSPVQSASVARGAVTVGHFIGVRVPEGEYVAGSTALGQEVCVRQMSALMVMQRPVSIADYYRHGASARNLLPHDGHESSDMPVSGLQNAEVDRYIASMRKIDRIPWRLPTVTEMERIRRGPAKRLRYAGEYVSRERMPRRHNENQMSFMERAGWVNDMQLRIATVVRPVTSLYDTIWVHESNMPDGEACVSLVNETDHLRRCLSGGLTVRGYNLFPAWELLRYRSYLFPHEQAPKKTRRTADAASVSWRANRFGVMGYEGLRELAMDVSGNLYVFGAGMSTHDIRCHMAPYREKLSPDSIPPDVTVRLVVDGKTTKSL